MLLMIHLTNDQPITGDAKRLQKLGAGFAVVSLLLLYLKAVSLLHPCVSNATQLKPPYDVNSVDRWHISVRHAPLNNTVTPFFNATCSILPSYGSMYVSCILHWYVMQYPCNYFQYHYMQGRFRRFKYYPPPVIYSGHVCAGQYKKLMVCIDSSGKHTCQYDYYVS